MSIQWKPYHPPNTPLYRANLPQNTMQYLWSRIRQAKIDEVPWGHRLAGNISSSLGLKDENDYFLNTVVSPLVKRIIRQDPQRYTPALSPDVLDIIMRDPPLSMIWWVNFQNQLEFNPQHCHEGIVSYVIWMKIPTDPQEQHNQSFKSDSASDFQFSYTNIMGEINELPIIMDKSMEGVMMVFPSKLRHQVYPFYNCDENRISIAGNVLYKLDKYE